MPRRSPTGYYSQTSATRLPAGNPTHRRSQCSTDEAAERLTAPSGAAAAKPTNSTSAHHAEEASDSKMPCYHPKPAWQAKLGGQLSFSYVRGYRVVMAPCTTCIGCIKAHAQAWAFRCHLEATQHLNNAFATLTFDDAHLPFTLDWRRDGQTFLKALRQRYKHTLRFFASGEYGSNTHRPHYHFLLFGYDGLGADGQRMVQDSWGKGQIRLDPVTPARIAYVAGYTDKKAEDRFLSVEHCDPETGEAWQPPFIKMSLGGRNGHGIGGHAKQWTESWRLFAVHQDQKLQVPRYLHNEWRKTATAEQLEQLQAERDAFLLNRDNSIARLEAAETIAIKKQKEQSTLRAQNSQKREFQKAGIRRFLAQHQPQDSVT